MLDGIVFRGSEAIAAGLLTPANLRSRSWQRLFQGVYAPASLEVTHEVRCAAAITLLAPEGSTVAGRSAAALYGAAVGLPTDPVELLLPPPAQPCRHPGIRVHHGLLAPPDRHRRGELPITSPVRTCWDLARWLDPIEAVAWIDRLLVLGRVSPTELTAYRRSGLGRGLRRYERALSLVDARSESPQESRLRARLALAGLRPPAVQYEIYDGAGRFVARVDLAWPQRRVAVEYDGLWHVGSVGQMHSDRRRLSALGGLGWTGLHVTSARLRDDFDAVVRDLRAALRQR